VDWVRIAWKYFENNYDSTTGLINSVHNYPSTTMWDTGSYLMALISAFRMEIIDSTEFDSRMGKALSSMHSLELFDGMLPNKAYNVHTLEMTDYINNPTPRGVGWSAIDIGRLFVPFKIIVWNYPQYTL